MAVADSSKTTQELTSEITALKKRIEELEALEVEHRQAESSLKQLEWMISRKVPPSDAGQAKDYDQGYGDLTELNRDGLILKSIGRERLGSLVNDYLELLGTSSAIYEKNGDYAFGIFSSGWCRMMDSASRRFCNTSDNVEALSSGCWLCHESCWTDCSQKAITEGTPVDTACNGGIRLYAVPIIASGNVVGAINFGYGDPPRDPEKLRKLADAYNIKYDDLVREAHAYSVRPPFIGEFAKRRLHATARLIGSMIETKQVEEALRESNERLTTVLDSMDAVIYIADMETYEVLFSNLYARKAWGDGVGQKCWSVFQKDQEGPCVFCTNEKLLDQDGKPTGVYFWEFQNTINGKWFDCRDMAIPWTDGRMVRMEIATEITEHKQAEEQLRHRLMYEELLSRISVMAVEQEDLGRFLNDTLKIMGETLGVSRVYLFEHHHETDSMDNTVEWCAPEESPQKDALQGVPSAALSWWMVTLREGGTICFSDIEDIPDEGAKEILRPQGIRSLLVVPLFVASRYYGFMGFDECRFHREWPGEDVEILLAISRIIAGAIYKKKAEEDIERERQQLLSIFNSIEESVYISDPETYEILYVNRKLADTLQRDCVGGVCYEELQGLDEPCPFCTNDIILKQKPEPHYWEYYNPNLARQFFLVDRIIEWPDGRNVRFEMATDITDRIRAEKALRESEGKYRILLETAAESIYIAQDGMIKFCNKRLSDFTGYDLEELTTMPFADLIYPDDRQMVLDRHLQRLEGKEGPSRYSYRFIDAEGNTRWAEMSVALISWEGKLATLCLATDITDHKRAEEEKIELERRLSRAQKLESIGTLAGGIAHDFNNLLMGIQGNASLMMLDLDPTHPHYERLRQVEQNVASGADLTKQLLGFAQGGRYEIKPTSINEIVEKSFTMFGRTKKEISLHRKYSKDPCIVEVDRSQMAQVFVNLFVNAWQAMPEGGNIFIETEKVVLDEPRAIAGAVNPGCYVKVNVTDTGIGLDERTRERIFDPFFTTKEMGRGTGLGLATVYGIIRGHGGMINVYSELGHGTNFTLYIPASEKDPIGEKKPTEEVLRGTETILLVDDEKMVLDVSRDMLESLGYRVYPAGSGQEAVALCREKKDEIDLVILDMIMPGISGSGTFDQLREINPDVKVLLASGYSINGQAQDIIDRGCDGFIQKPFLLGKLSRRVREVFDN